MNLYSIHDKKAELFAKPFQLQNDGTAIRALQSTILEQKELSAYPEDYTLTCLGSYNESTGLIVANTPPLIVAPLTQIVQAAKNAAEQT